LDVHQDKVWPLFRDSRERLLTIFRLGDLIVGGGKHIADNLATIRLVLHHQKGQEQTSSGQAPISALPLKADIDRWHRQVCFVSAADIQVAFGYY
jgi:hypothetical protein